MAGRKGQNNPSPHKRGNQWTTGQQKRGRDRETIAFRPQKGLMILIKEDIAERGITKQEWCDEAVALMLQLKKPEPQTQIQAIDPILLDAIQLSIATKSTAIRNQKRSKRPDENLIQKWKLEVESLEKFLDEV